MSSFFYSVNKEEIKINFPEIKRYLGMKKSSQTELQIDNIIEESANKMRKILTPNAVYSLFDLKIEENIIFFADTKLISKDLARNLSGCTKIALFAATIGSGADILIKRANFTSTVQAACYQAAGAMFIEELVELLNEKIKNDAQKGGFSTKPRFSPGFGDVSLSLQKDFFRLLPCAKIGLTLRDTLIMAPEKSVTGFIGIKPQV